MNLYSTTVFLHVVTAIFGLGPLTLLAVACSGSTLRSLPPERIAQGLRVVGWSLAGLFATGVIIIALVGRSLGEAGWMRASVGLFVVLGFLHGMARRQLRKALSATASAGPMKSVGRILWIMCAVIVAITYLMEAKPW